MIVNRTRGVLLRENRQKKATPPVDDLPPVPKAVFFTKDQIGAGCWYTIHNLAANGFYSALRTVLVLHSANFTCPRCQAHIREKMQTFPSRDSLLAAAEEWSPEDEAILDDYFVWLGMQPDLFEWEPRLPKPAAAKLFKWTVDFHNEVTERQTVEDPKIQRRRLTRHAEQALFNELRVAALFPDPPEKEEDDDTTTNIIEEEADCPNCKPTTITTMHHRRREPAVLCGKRHFQWSRQNPMLRSITAAAAVAASGGGDRGVDAGEATTA